MYLLHLLLCYGIYYFMVRYIVSCITNRTRICLLLYFIVTHIHNYFNKQVICEMSFEKSYQFH